MISALSLGLSPPVSTHQRRHAFERVYAEGRWIAGADGALEARVAAQERLLAELLRRTTTNNSACVNTAPSWREKGEEG